MTEYSELVKEAIKKARDKENEQRQKAIISEMYEGKLLETEYIKRNGVIWQQIRIDGEVTSENRVYKANTEKPYTRGFGQYWYLDNDAKEAMKSVM